MQYRKSLKIPKDAVVIGHVGRFNTQKNHEYLIRIFDELYKKAKNAYLVLIGTGATLDEIKKKVVDLGLENRVIFTGAVDNVSDYLSVFDVMLLPSLYEGLPLVVIEWQISGLPCIISDSITKECAITSLVKFESIKESPTVWVDDIEKLTIQDRSGNKDKIFNEIKAAGYDIQTGAGKLKKIYDNLYFVCSKSSKLKGHKKCLRMKD